MMTHWRERPVGAPLDGGAGNPGSRSGHVGAASNDLPGPSIGIAAEGRCDEDQGGTCARWRSFPNSSTCLPFECGKVTVIPPAFIVPINPEGVQVTARRPCDGEPRIAGVERIVDLQVLAFLEGVGKTLDCIV
jgi:hypothetical protein